MKRSAAASTVRDISAATLPKDFERNPRIHRCYEMRQRELLAVAEPVEGIQINFRSDGRGHQPPDH